MEGLIQTVYNIFTDTWGIIGFLFVVFLFFCFIIPTVINFYDNILFYYAEKKLKTLFPEIRVHRDPSLKHDDKIKLTNKNVSLSLHRVDFFMGDSLEEYQWVVDNVKIFVEDLAKEDLKVIGYTLGDTEDKQILLLKHSLLSRIYKNSLEVPLDV